MKRIFMLVFVIFGLIGNAQVYVPGDHNNWNLDATNEATLKSDLGGSQKYYGITISASIDDLFKIVKDSYDNTWGGGYWITSYDNRWAPSFGGANAIWKGSPNSYIHLCIEDPADYINTNIPIGIMTLSSLPITIDYVSQIGIQKNSIYYSNTAEQTVSITLSAEKSPEELIYLRYSTDNWATDNFVLSTGTGTAFTAAIPAQSDGTMVRYYVLTTTLTYSPGNDLDIYPDLMTINYDNNSGTPYSYFASNPRSKTTGDWNSSATWLFNSVPSGGDVIISSNDNVTMNVNVNINSLTVETSGTFTASDGTARTLTIANDGILTNSGTFTSGTGTVVFAGTGTVNGTVGFNDVVLDGGGVNFGSSSTINGTLSMDGGWITFGNAPSYGSSSVLKYSNGGTWGRGDEWKATSGAGYPNDVLVTNNTLLDMGANSGADVYRECAGDLIIDVGSEFSMNEAGNLMTKSVGVNGNVNCNGEITLSGTTGGDLKLKGDLVFGLSSVFNANERAIFFNGQTTQTVEATGAGTYTIAYIIVGEAEGSATTLQLVGGNIKADAPQGGNAITFSNADDKIDLNGNKITIGTDGVSSLISGSGSFTGSSSSQMDILGTGDLSTINFDQTTPGTTNVLKNLTVSRTSGDVTIGNDVVIPATGVWTIGSQSSLTVSGALTNNAGNTGLVIKSDATGTGSLITNGTVSGDVTVERYIPQGDSWHLLSAPTPGMTILGSDFVPTPDGENKLPTTFDFYSYDEGEAATPWINIRGENQIVNSGFDGTFLAGKGYMVAYSDAYAATPYDFVGGVVSDNQTISLTKSGTNATYDGWNLVGNPFPCTIAGNDNADAANNFLKTNATNILDDDNFGYYYYDNAQSDYQLVNNAFGAHYIEVGQGFFVKAKADNVDLIFSASDRKNGSATYYKSVEDRNSLMIQLNSSTGQMNQTEIVFMDGMTRGLDIGYDGAKMQGNLDVSLYTYLVEPYENIFAIQALPTNLQDEAVKIGMLVSKEGEYSLSFNPSDLFLSMGNVALYDRITGEKHMITSDFNYEFMVNTPGQIDDRFEIHFAPVGISTQPTQPQAHAYVNGQQLTILSEGNTQVDIFDVQGRLLSSEVVNVSGSFSRALNLNSGLYIVRLQNNRAVSSTKVIVK